jgi:hypothetical protein
MYIYVTTTYIHIHTDVVPASPDSNARTASRRILKVEMVSEPWRKEGREGGRKEGRKE